MGSGIEGLETSEEASTQGHPGWGSPADTGKAWRRVMPQPGKDGGKLQAIKAAHFCSRKQSPVAVNFGACLPSQDPSALEEIFTPQKRELKHQLTF